MTHSLDTINGELVHAEVDRIHLDSEAVSGAVILGIPDELVAIKLTPDDVAALAHALSCALIPYGSTIFRSRPVDEPPC